MASRLYQYLLDIYEPRRERSVFNGHEREPIQIDDQNDQDNVGRFCTVFTTVGRRERMLVEIEGALPPCEDLWHFAESNGGRVDPKAGRIGMEVTPATMWILSDLATRLRRSADDPSSTDNPDWPSVSRRTADSLDRFVCAVREFPGAAGASTAQEHP